MDISREIKRMAGIALEKSHQLKLEPEELLVNETKPEFEGDYTLVLFSMVRRLKQTPEKLGAELGTYLTAEYPDLIAGFNVIKGFLNLTIADSYWIDFLRAEGENDRFGIKEKNHRRVMVEYSSPNTNKPLHLGHLRNNFIGWTVAEIYKANGYETVKTCIANDRGIHICKSMLAWRLFAGGATPQSTNTKGDHFVGDYYVRFNQEYKKQVENLIAEGIPAEEAEKNAPLMQAAQQMLIDWEAGKPEVIALWKTMNSWVYAGFAQTYQRIGSDFDRVYYESDTYLLGKDLVAEGLKKGVFFSREDGSVWIDLSAEGLDQKIVQRSDGTAVYITQDIGLAVNKYEEFNNELSIYVVGDEQNYHFKVLKLICQKLGLPSADGIFHLSYGMVELPTGRMKTREGTVVDADELIDEMVSIAEKHTESLGKVKDFTPGELASLYDTIGLGALKFYLLRVDPKKRILFNPEESIDFHGFTGPFIQYTYARIQSILRKEEAGKPIRDEITSLGKAPESAAKSSPLLPLEKKTLIELEKYPAVIETACLEMNPSVIANYAYGLAKAFSSFYTEHSITHAETGEKKEMRLRLARLTAIVLRSATRLLGIRVPERM